MKISTIYIDNCEEAAIVVPEGIVPLRSIITRISPTLPLDLFSLLTTGEFYRLLDWYNVSKEQDHSIFSSMVVPRTSRCFAPLYRRPRKIWGIGLNYAAHAKDLSEKVPENEPASFMKPDTTIIGHEDTILIPHQSQKTTGEAELGIIFGRECRNMEEDKWLGAVAGFTTVLDMTAEDILRKNPRYLTRSKCFDTFFSFGPVLLTPDEIPDVMALKVSTVINGIVQGENVVSNMTFPPPYLVSFHSHFMSWLPGDVLSTGTPQAAALNDGDVLECRITGFETLVNIVYDKKICSR